MPSVFVVDKLQDCTETFGDVASLAVLGIELCDFRSDQFFTGDLQTFDKTCNTGA